MRPPIVHELITKGKAGCDRVVGQAVPNDVEGLRWLASRGIPRPAHVFTVFAAKCPVFARMCSLSGQMCPVSGQMCPLFPPISPNVSTRPAHVSTRSLDGDSRRPGLPDRSGSDFGGRAALGTRRASARGPGHRWTLSDLPFRDLCVTRGGLPGRPSPQPSPTGRGGKSGRAFKNAGRFAKVALQREGRRWPWCSIIGAGDGPGVTGGRPGVRRGLRPGPGGRIGG